MPVRNYERTILKSTTSLEGSSQKHYRFARYNPPRRIIMRKRPVSLKPIIASKQLRKVRIKEISEGTTKDVSRETFTNRCPHYLNFDVHLNSTYQNRRLVQYNKSQLLPEGWLSELYMFYSTLRTIPILEKIRAHYEQIYYSKVGLELQDHIYYLTPEGSRLFFKLIEEPNPNAEKSYELGKKLITDEQCSKFGKDPMTLKFTLKSRKDD